MLAKARDVENQSCDDSRQLARVAGLEVSCFLVSFGAGHLKSTLIKNYIAYIMHTKISRAWPK